MFKVPPISLLTSPEESFDSPAFSEDTNPHVDKEDRLTNSLNVSTFCGPLSKLLTKLQTLSEEDQRMFFTYALILSLVLTSDVEFAAVQDLLQRDVGQWFAAFTDDSRLISERASGFDFLSCHKNTLQLQTTALLSLLLNLAMHLSPKSVTTDEDFTPFQNLVLYSLAFNFSIGAPTQFQPPDLPKICELLGRSKLQSNNSHLSLSYVTEWWMILRQHLPICFPEKHLVCRTNLTRIDRC